MELTLKRRFLGGAYTIGTLFINGEYFCDTLEDPVRNLEGGEQKIAGNTAIPYGRYQVIVNRSPKFKRDLPRLIDVPFFEGVLIHRGNTSEDTAGCILVGENKVKGKVINSTEYELRLTNYLKLTAGAGEPIFITIEKNS